MIKLLNSIKTIFSWLDGKKTKIFAACYLLQDQVFAIWWPQGEPEIVNKVVETIIKVGMFYGLGDNVIKKLKGTTTNK
jgi:hypothetical protein